MAQVYSVLCVLGQLGMSRDIPHSAALPWPRSTVSCVYWDNYECPRISHTLLHYHVPGLQCPVCTGTSRNVPGHPTLCCNAVSQVYSVLCAPGQVGMSWDIPHYAAWPCPRSTVSCVYRESRNVPGHSTLCCTAISQVYSVLCVLGQVGMSQDK